LQVGNPAKAHPPKVVPQFLDRNMKDRRETFTFTLCTLEVS
jgi:hypothetical protein